MKLVHTHKINFDLKVSWAFLINAVFVNENITETWLPLVFGNTLDELIWTMCVSNMIVYSLRNTTFSWLCLSAVLSNSWFIPRNPKTLRDLSIALLLIRVVTHVNNNVVKIWCLRNEKFLHLHVLILLKYDPAIKIKIILLKFCNFVLYVNL